jgi:hypothetical protein
LSSPFSVGRFCQENSVAGEFCRENSVGRFKTGENPGSSHPHSHNFYIASTMAYRLARASLTPAGAAATVTAISWTGERTFSQATSRMVTRPFQNLLLHNKQSFYSSMARHRPRFFSDKPKPPITTTTTTTTTTTSPPPLKEAARPPPSAAPQSKIFMEWYEGHLQASPLKTKMASGGILWGVGDAVAQLVPHVVGAGGSLTEYKYDYPRTGRAAFFGLALHAPTSHVHFNFLEWMTHKVGVTGLGIPVFKTIMEQVCKVMSGMPCILSIVLCIVLCYSLLSRRRLSTWI